MAIIFKTPFQQGPTCPSRQGLWGSGRPSPKAVVGRSAARVPWGRGPQGGSLTWDLARPAASQGTASRQPPPWASPEFLLLVAVCPTNAPQTPGAARAPSN